jgi:prolyl-tRNA synthetase
MRWMNTCIPTLKEVPQEAESVSQQLLLRAGFIRMLMAGAYSYLPLGFKVLRNIEEIVRQEMSSCGGAELLLPALQPVELWQRTGRDKDIGEVMFRFIDRRKRSVCLGPTHEEVVTDLIKGQVSSYRQLPLVVFQIQTKFRDEIRPRFGLIRACEFIMKDAYSFDKDEAGLDKNYVAMYEAYGRIFKRCGLDVLITEADSGVMGGKVSHEFMVPAAEGEDMVCVCARCKKARVFKEESGSLCPECNAALEKTNTIEVGHIFKLGTKYSSSLGANFVDIDGKLKPMIMGCYGIGVSRLIAAVAAQNNDKDGLIWPNEVAPYKAHIILVDATDERITALGQEMYAALEAQGICTLLDDRDERAGVKFKDADLIGIPLQLIIGKEALKAATIEMKIRRTREKIFKPKHEIVSQIKAFYSK